MTPSREIRGRAVLCGAKIATVSKSIRSVLIATWEI